jgi:23S rRNA (cytidine1920-2'-O)/16S rRNA (cytidine1409-2'-O)-methyltransferase
MARLDVHLASAGLVESRERAQALILAGKVRVDGETVRRPDRAVKKGEDVSVEAGPQYASRGALKLWPALKTLGVDPGGLVCADIGASTGGFTDVLLRRGAARVYALDVGRGLLHWRLRQDPRVVVIERVNARDLTSFPEAVSLITADLSFIGLEKVLPAIRAAAPIAEVVALFKPQFQVERTQVGKGGIVRDEAAVAAALARFREWCVAHGYKVQAEAPSEVTGAGGNREIFVHLLPRPTAPRGGEAMPA